MTKKYKIEKRWSDTFDCWEWLAYERQSLWVLRWWNPVPGVCEETKEVAESKLLSYIERRTAIEKDKSNGSEEYFLEI